jgi:predicted O-linked N-acetylglucosamine transferase (SPINDLY family)
VAGVVREERSDMTISQALEIAAQHHRAGHLANAEAVCRQILSQEPNQADALHLLGLIASQSGQPEVALDLIQKAVAANSPAAVYLSNLGAILTSLDRCDEAIPWLRRAIELRPDFAGAHYNLGKALKNQGAFDAALAAYRTAIHFQPDLAPAHNNLGTILHDRGQIDEAIAAYRRAIEFAPGFAEAHTNLGNALKDRGCLDEAIPALRRAIELQPQNSLAGSNLILALQYCPARSAEVIAERQRWNERHAAPLRALWRAHENVPDPERPLRVGYVSADFRQHVVGRTLLPCFEAHDRAQFEFVCYSAFAVTDAIGERFRRGAVLWRETAALSDEKLAETIREDRIDILVDLSLHTSGHRLLVFARKPAPVQISWLGYPGTTGMEAMDYRITDRFLEPPGLAAQAGCEQPLWLPNAWCCYGAPEDSPEPAELPAAHGAGLTFGSFNTFAKINERVLEAWTEILRRVPESRLLLLSKAGRLPQVTEFFEHRGVPPGRVEFLDYYPPPDSSRGESSAEYLRRYGRIDIALDPFPYNGMTTTCDALWMGVPVVALAGATPVGRASFSLLSNVGLPELTAHSEHEYIELAAGLARDLPRLASLRATLRERMKRSPLLDAAQFARDLEAAYRQVWRAWCADREERAGTRR